MLINWWDSPSVIHEDGKYWPLVMAEFDCNAIAHEFPELHITPDEAHRIVDNVLERVAEEMHEYMENYLGEVR